MNHTAGLSRLFTAIKVGLLGFVLLTSANAPAGPVLTNLTERWVTNVVEVKMQTSRVVTEYRTNWVQEAWNNIIDVYATNRITRPYTNKIMVDLVRTNFVNAYQTNLTLIPVFRTNLVTKYVTNRINIDNLRTNVVQAYHTNVKVLRLTNWVTVLVFKTNWVTQPVTNIISIDLPAAGGRASAALTMDASLSLQARRCGPPAGGKPAEVQLTVRSTNAAAGPLRVQQWRVERDDGSILLFGQDQEFRHPLPVGKYKVEVKAQQAGADQLVAALGTLSVTPGDVFLQESASAKSAVH